MPRPAKVWYRADVGWWMITIGGKKTRLIKGPDDAEHRLLAEEKYHEERARRRLAPEASRSLVADVVDAFLRHSRIHFAPDTHRIYKWFLQQFVNSLAAVPARDIRPFHIQRWLDEKIEAKQWGETTVYNARKSVLRVFSWAAQQKILVENPLAGIRNQKPRPRQRAITPDEFAKLYEVASGPLQDVLLALYRTGARPKEVRDLMWGMVQADRWILPDHKTAKRTGRPRVVYLDATMRAMMDRLRGNGHAHVFLNTRNEPWSRSALRQQVWRLRKRLGLAEDVCAYLFRHGFGTRAIKSGESGPVAAELMGHASQEMVTKVYVHLADEREHLAAAVDRINASVGERTDSHPTRRRALPIGRKPVAGEVRPEPPAESP